MGLIYRTTNLINGKMYIGKQVNERKEYYLGSGIYLNKAVKKYGKENFKKEILIKGITCRKELSEIEKYLIAFYQADKSKQYYNICAGGEGGGISIDSIYWTEEKKEIQRLAAQKRLESYGENHPFIGCRKGVKLSKKACKAMSDSRIGIPLLYKRKPVLQYDLSGNFIQRFESGEIAVKELNLPTAGSSHITMVCSEQYTRKTAYGFIWKYEN